MGATLVCHPAAADTEGSEFEGYGAWLRAIAAFQQSVDAALPGMYAWFDKLSLHVTVRALLP